MLDNFLKPIVNIPLKRLGSKSDGGYFVPTRIINKSKKIISCGLGSDWSFENSLRKKNQNIEIIFYDHTTNLNFWIKHTIKSIYYFLRYNNDIKNVFKFINYIYFFNKKNITHKKLKISKKNNFANKEISLNKILLFEKNNLILKIDIEGDEYFILKDIIKYQNKINCLIIEFHKIKKNIKKLKKFFKQIKILKNCNISPNNSIESDKYGDPKVIEVIFINRKFLFKNDMKKRIKIQYLQNNPHKKKIFLKFN